MMPRPTTRPFPCFSPFRSPLTTDSRRTLSAHARCVQVECRHGGVLPPSFSGARYPLSSSRLPAQHGREEETRMTMSRQLADCRRRDRHRRNRHCAGRRRQGLVTRATAFVRAWPTKPSAKQSQPAPRTVTPLPPSSSTSTAYGRRCCAATARPSTRSTARTSRPIRRPRSRRYARRPAPRKSSSASPSNPA